MKLIHPLFVSMHTPGVGQCSAGNSFNIFDAEDSIYIHDVLVITSLSEDKPPLIDLPFYIKLFIGIVMTMSLLIGSFFKVILYSHVLGSKKRNRGCRPINILIVTSSVIHHTNHIGMFIWIIRILISGAPVVDAIGQDYCHVLHGINLFAIGYLTVGNLGIAIYRVLYIRHEHWVKYGIGERLLLWMIWSLGVMICSILSFLHVLELNNGQFPYDVCNGISGTHAKILIDYELSHGYEVSTTTYLQIPVVYIGIAMQVIQLCIYIWFLRFRYKNDNKATLKKLLSPDVIRARNMKNIETFMGQFYGFMMESTFGISILLFILFAGEKTMDFKAFANIARFINFGLLSAVEVFSSPRLKSHLKKVIRRDQPTN